VFDPCKVQESGCPTIACTIKQAEISRALLDLGANINLLPFSVYQQLGLGDLSPIRVTIQLADRSVKVSKRKINNVLIQVGKFIYPIDFLILETQPVFNPLSQTPVILGCPFLTTANAIINCRNRSIRLTFRDMIRKVNIFNLEKQPRDVKDQTFEVNLIKNMTSEHRKELKLETESEFELESMDFNLDQSVESAVSWASSPI